MLCIVKPYWHQACSLSYERTRNGCFNVAGLRCGLCPTRSDDLEQSLSVVCPDYRLGPGNGGQPLNGAKISGVRAAYAPEGLQDSSPGFQPWVSTREPSNQDESPCMGVSSREGSSVGSPWTSFPSLLTWIAGGRWLHFFRSPRALGFLPLRLSVGLPVSPLAPVLSSGGSQSDLSSSQGTRSRLCPASRTPVGSPRQAFLRRFNYTRGSDYEGSNIRSSFRGSITRLWLLLHTLRAGIAAVSRTN